MHSALLGNEYDLNLIRQEVMDFARTGLFRYTFDGRILFIDKNALRILELEDEFPNPSMVTGKNISDLIIYIQPQMMIRNKILEKGLIRWLEYSFETLKRTKKWVMLDSYLVPDGGANEDVIQVIIRDITDIRTAATGVKDFEERLKMFFEFIPEALFITNGNGTFLDVNKAAEELTGYTKVELIGRSILLMNLIEPGGLPEFTAFLDGCIQGQPAGPGEFVFIRKDGTRVNVEVRTRSIPSALNGANLVMGIMRDITLRKLEEKALKESEKHLRMKLDFMLSPEQDVKDFTLSDLLNLDDIQRIQDAFAKVTGAATVITDTNSNLITRPSNYMKICRMIQNTSRGHERCALSDKLRAEQARTHAEPFYRQCLSCGFMDASAPIIVAGKHIANWVVGQVNTGAVDRNRIEEFAEYIGADIDEMLEAFDEVPRMSTEQFESVLDLLWVMTQEISKLAYDNLRFAKDITHLRLAKEALRESEEKYKCLIESLNEGFWGIDKDGYTSYVNTHMAEMLGYTAEEMVGRHLFSFMDEDWVKTCKYYLERPRNGVSEKRNFEFLRKDGSKASVILSTAPLYDESGQYIGAIAAVMDLTEQKLIQDQLYQVQKMEAIGQLAGGIAHDFNNLLTGILGYASLLKMEAEKDSSIFNIASTIEKAAERAAELTRQLLGFARRGKHQVVPVDIHKGINEAVVLFKGTFRRNIRIVMNLASPNAIVSGDPGQLQQVLMNLGINARDAMPQGGTLTFHTETVNLDDNFSFTHHDLTPGEYIMVVVSDTGIGVPKDIQDRIFEPFFTTKKQGMGTGMGLSMVYGIVKNHGGLVEIESEEGKGTTFRVYLPLTKQVAAESTTDEDIPTPPQD